MKNTFRQYHLHRALGSYKPHEKPLDVHLSTYFRENRAIGSKDRKCIGEKAFSAVRWLGLIDHFCEDGHSWEERIKIFESLDIKKKVKDPSIPPHVRVSFPKSLYEKIVKHYGEKKGNEICNISNTCAPITIRANLLKTNRQALFNAWKDSYDIRACEKSLWGIHFEGRHNFQIFPEFRTGMFEVQDEASQLASDLIDAKPGDQVLDYCAGSGGKTLAFAHKLQGKGQIFLHDIRPHILVQARRRLKRAGVENAQILAHDSPLKKKLRGTMDWVLVDAPCSGTGTLRRNTDIKWKFTQELLDRLIEQQRAIFKEALTFLRPGGTICYTTCSLLPEENDQQVLYFQNHFDVELVARPLITLPTLKGMDGFYGISLKRFV